MFVPLEVLEGLITLIQRGTFMRIFLSALLFLSVCAVVIGLTYNKDARFVVDQVPYDSNGVSSPLVFTGHRCV